MFDVKSNMDLKVSVEASTHAYGRQLLGAIHKLTGALFRNRAGERDARLSAEDSGTEV
jgi:hypothetical protein